MEARVGDAIADLDAQLRKLRQLQDQGLIDAGEFDAKKAAFLAKPLRAGDFADEVKVAKALNTAGILTNDEFAAIKRKILQIGD